MNRRRRKFHLRKNHRGWAIFKSDKAKEKRISMFYSDKEEADEKITYLASR